MYAFVLMPFSPEFDDVFKIGIQEATKEAGVKVERLDTQIFVSDMIEKIYTEIDKADFIIADMSGRNANVFYEVGYCDAKKKIVILLTNNVDDIPFDFKHRPHIIYGSSISKLRKELTKKIIWAVEEANRIKQDPINLGLTVLSSEIERKEYTDIAKLKIRLELHNVTDTLVENIESLYIYLGEGWSLFYNNALCNHTDSEIKPFSTRHIIHPDLSSIPPHDWLPVDLEMSKPLFYTWGSEEKRKDKYELDGALTISINTKLGKFIKDEKLKVTVEYFEAPF